ncbi:MAG: ComEC/Rec2 family competence protein [Candidatus Obscuribacterales bacterium]|nr:ComEC/Rec2 family competence protein [Candidatus Obscuribacterales bacterium]
MDKLSYRRLFAWAVLCCTLTAMCGLGRVFGLGCVIGGIFACPLLACWYRSNTVASDSLTAIIFRLLLLLLPLLSFVYAGFLPESQNETSNKARRHNGKSAWFENRRQPTIQSYIGKRVVILASIDRIIAQKAPPAQILLVTCSRISFPEERAVDGRACLVVGGQVVPMKVAIGDLISVACYLRSSKFSLTNSSKELVCSYLAQHKKSVDGFSFISVDDLTILPRRPVSVSFEQNSFAAVEHFVQSAIFSCRQEITDMHQQYLGADTGALLTSMVLGQNAVDLPKAIVDTFRNVGLSHIVAASGFNLTVVILVTYWLLRPLYLPGNSSEYACLAMMALYVALAGLSSSVARAALMSTFILVSRMTQRRIFIGSALAAALILTWLPSPQALSDVGLQLSYVATIGIIAGAKSLGQWLNSRPSWFFQQCADTLAVTVIAQLSVLPIQLYYFGTIGLTFLPANLLVVPLVAPVTIFGFIASVLILMGSISPFSGFFVFPVVSHIDQLLQYPLTYIIWLTGTLSSFQSAKLQVKQPSISAIAIYYACIVCSLFLLRFPDKKLAVIVLVLLSIACLSVVHC